jgi:adenylosuccinate lyase
MNPLYAITSIDGRYRAKTEALAPFFSEAALFRYRIMVEVEYLLALAEEPGVDLRDITGKEREILQGLYRNFSEQDAVTIQSFDLKGHKGTPATNHDVKAGEYFIKDKLAGTLLKDIVEWVHFGLTSYDINDTAFALMISDALHEVIIPALTEILDELNANAAAYKSVAMLGRTHGQPASPTTFGKEFKIFASRLDRQLQQLSAHQLLTKFSGATGNYHALHAAYPKVDWIGFTLKFIASLNKDRAIKLNANLLTAQTDPHDSLAELFDITRRANTVLMDFVQDIWRYISDGWIVQKPVAGEIGSSTMPHKVNPIDFENAEGNLGQANAMFEFFSRKLPASRLQRDLSDSTVLRNIGTPFAHSLIAYMAIVKGMGKIAVNEVKVKNILDHHPEVIAEAIQTVLRREGAVMPYEKLKALTRGKEVTLADLHAFIDGLDVADAVKQQLKSFTPGNYLGLSEHLAEL